MRVQANSTAQTALDRVTTALVHLDFHQRRRVLYAAAVFFGIIRIPGTKKRKRPGRRDGEGALITRAPKRSA